MNAKVFTVVCAALLAGCASGPADRGAVSEADTWLEDSFVECADLDYRPVVTSQFPEIADACRGVVNGKDGAQYVKVDALVHSVKRSTRDRSVRRVTLNVLDRRGETLRLFSFVPPRDFRFTVEGEEKTADYMTRGEKLRVYLPPDRWEIVWTLETATPMDTLVHVEDIETFLFTSNLEADEAFGFDSAELSVAGQAQLSQVVVEIGNYVPAISIFGYTDRIGDERYNLGLSQRRADAAKDYLVSLGVPADRVSAVGRGEANPVVECKGMQGDALKDCLQPNRRAEIVFLVPAVADVGSASVIKTYEKPSGRKVQVAERVGVVQVEEISGMADEFLTACQTEIQSYCDMSESGGGRVLGCLAANKQAGYEFSAGCNGELVKVIDAVLFRRLRFNLVGAACSAEIAACDSAPIGTKLDCVSSQPMSEDCSAAMSLLSTAAF